MRDCVYSRVRLALTDATPILILGLGMLTNRSMLKTHPFAKVSLSRAVSSSNVTCFRFPIRMNLNKIRSSCTASMSFLF